MFEFGRDLRRLFEKARDSYDLGWLELVSVALVETEARHQTTDAGRVSCARPFDGWMRAAALWREHARRTGSSQSLQKAEQAGRDAAQAAQNDDQAMRAAIDVGHTSMLAFDLYGAPRRLAGLLDNLERLPAARKADTGAAVEALKARLKARQARITSDPAQLTEAASRLSEAMARLSPTATPMTEEMKLDRAALSLEAGLLARSPTLLDQAGRELRILVEEAQPDERPVSRARALALCGTGMAALASIAGDSQARGRAHTLFDAAADQFSAEHSPLDWASIQLLRSERGPVAEQSLNEARQMTNMPGLIIGAMMRERHMANAVRRAEDEGDSPSLFAMQQDMLLRLAEPMEDAIAVEWSSDQITLARIKLALTPDQPEQRLDLGMALYEAADAATLAGVPALAQRARELMASIRDL